jgi:hypothetical protein
VGINTTTPSHRLHVYNNTNSISAIYADNSAISSSGTSWTYGSSNVSGVQGISTTDQIIQLAFLDIGSQRE